MSVQPSTEEIAIETEKFQSIPDPQLQESQFVHDVYNHIAKHFSQTRYKPWPIVAGFLESQKKYSLGIDVGCGNGKYLAVNPNLYILGSDHSSGLIDQALELHSKEWNSDLMLSDGLTLPHESNTFDFAISIAVIHHFATEQRRVEAIKEILRCLRVGGRALIYCWALEQSNSRRGYSEGMDQDVLVPWVLNKNQPKKVKTPKSKNQHKPNQIEDSDPASNPESAVLEDCEKEKKESTSASEGEPKEATPMRFYHLYKSGELKDNAVKAGGKVVDDGYERDNWWVVVEKST